MITGPSAVWHDGETRRAVLRICLDANIWIAALIAARSSVRRSAALTMVQAAWRMRAFGRPLQLIVSHELVDTVVRVTERLGHTPLIAKEWGDSIIDLAAAGPLRLGPSLVLSGRDQLAMHDREDAGVLAACFAARADLLVTDNLRDFVTNDSEQLETQSVSFKDGRTRQLFSIIHERQDGVQLVVMHPVDVLAWMRKRRIPTASMVRHTYSGAAAP